MAYFLAGIGILVAITVLFFKVQIEIDAMLGQIIYRANPIRRRRVIPIASCSKIELKFDEASVSNQYEVRLVTQSGNIPVDLFHDKKRLVLILKKLEELLHCGVYCWGKISEADKLEKSHGSKLEYPYF